MHPLNAIQAINVLQGWVGFKKSYVINRVGQAKCYVCLQGGWVGQKKAQTFLCNIWIVPYVVAPVGWNS